MYAERRARFLERIGSGVAVFPSAPVAIRNNDVEHDYRQHSDVFYLTGFEEPESVLVLSSVHPEHRMVLFVRERDPSREVWDGPRAGVEGAVKQFGADAAFPIGELADKLPDYLSNVDRLHYRLGVDSAFDQRLLDAVRVVRSRARTGVWPPTEIVDVCTTLHEMRLRKDDKELAVIRRAVAVTREAHLAAMQVTAPGRWEYEVEAEIQRVFRKHGSERPAYGSIVGSGPNATVLHYRKNDRRMKDGDLLLIDAGCEHGYYASDVTRTFPVNGRFSAEQRAVYDVVLAAQEAAIAAARPGATVDDVHEVAVRVLTEGMIDLGLVEGPLETAVEEARYKPYYMHRTSHFLGMDVHDVGRYYLEGQSRTLEPGFVITIEPGLYVSPAAEEAPARFRGIGVRIEDDILITGSEPDNLTAAIPKTADDVERACVP